jgi:hypothetical protein
VHLDPLRKQRNTLVSTGEHFCCLPCTPKNALYKVCLTVSRLLSWCRPAWALWWPGGLRRPCTGDAGRCRPQNSKRRCANVWNVDCLADRRHKWIYTSQSRSPSRRGGWPIMECERDGCPQRRSCFERLAMPCNSAGHRR